MKILDIGGSMGWYVGFKLHLLCNVINFVLTRANVDDRN